MTSADETHDSSVKDEKDVIMDNKEHPQYESSVLEGISVVLV